MKKLTLQQVFDTGVNGVLKQGGRSVNDTFEGICVYRGEDGFKCIIGHSINDSDYILEMENRDALYISVNFKNNLPDTFLLDSLQNIHDNTSETYNYDYCYNFLKKAIKFAEENNLSIENIEYELVKRNLILF